MPGSASARWVVLGCILVLLAACGGGSGAARNAATRFDDAVAQIARTLGLSADEVRAGFRARLPTSTMDDLAIQAERTRDEGAAALEQIAAKAASDARRQVMIETLYDATCEFVELAQLVANEPPETQRQVLEAALVDSLVEHGLDTSQASLQALLGDVQELYDTVSNQNTRALEDVAVDLACFAT